MTFDSSFISYFLNAGLVVKAVLLLLVVASIFSWSYIIQRAFYLMDVRAATAKFEAAFWTGGDLAKLYAELNKPGASSEGMATLFKAGFKEYVKLRKQEGIPPDAIMENVKRAMRVATMHEQDKLELHLPFLASVASTSPYIGLFGTVWGIMLSFRALAHVQQATISMVAPGIAEALIATAMGLFAAIPAVIAYNRYASDINRLLTRFDAFQDEFANILYRQSQLTIAVEA